MKLRLITLSLLLVFSFLVTSSIPATAQGTKPSDAYKTFLVRLYWAKKIPDFSQSLQATTRMHAESLTGQEAVDFFKQYKRSYVAKFVVIREEVVDDRAFIEGEGIGADLGRRVKATVRAMMVRENGVWKVMQTNWSGVINKR